MKSQLKEETPPQQLSYNFLAEKIDQLNDKVSIKKLLKVPGPSCTCYLQIDTTPESDSMGMKQHR